MAAGRASAETLASIFGSAGLPAHMSQSASGAAGAGAAHSRQAVDEPPAQVPRATGMVSCCIPLLASSPKTDSFQLTMPHLLRRRLLPSPQEVRGRWRMLLVGAAVFLLLMGHIRGPTGKQCSAGGRLELEGLVVLGEWGSLGRVRAVWLPAPRRGASILHWQASCKHTQPSAAASRNFDASPSEGGLGQIPEHSTEVSRAVAAAGGLGMDVRAGAGADARGSSDRHRHRVSGWMDGRQG